VQYSVNLQNARCDNKGNGEYNLQTAMHRVTMYLDNRISDSFYDNLWTLRWRHLTKRVTLPFIGQLSGDLAVQFTFWQCCLLSHASIAVAEGRLNYIGCECLGMISWSIWFEPHPEYQLLLWLSSDHESCNRHYIPTVHISSPINTSLFTIHNCIPI
jgi:hypothetical protein